MGFELTEELWEPAEKDGSTVPAGDPRARFLVGVPGQTLPDAEAQRLGLTKGQPAHKAVQPDDGEVANKSVQMGDPHPKPKRGAE